MEEAPRLTPGAVVGIWELPEEFRMLLSDGVHSQQSMLSTALNHLVRDGALRPGSIVQLQDITCNNFQGRRILSVIELDILQSECKKIRSPKIYDKTSLGGQEVNLPPDTSQTISGKYSAEPGMLGSAVATRAEPDTSQTISGKYSAEPGMLGSAVATRAEQRANNMSYGGPYHGVHDTVDSSSCQTVQPGPNNVLSGGSSGTMSAQSTVKANAVQPHSQQPLLNSHSVAPPPSNYGAQTIHMPHIYNVGPPPMLDATNFIRWKFLMKSHISASSIQLWRIIEDGFKIFDSSNLSPKEEEDKQLNAIALHIIEKSLTLENLAHISPFLSAKEAWDHLNKLFMGDSRIQRLKHDALLNEADRFVMNEDESPQELYLRLKALAVTLKDHGSTHVDDNWIKRKFLKATMPFEKDMSYMIRHRSDFHTLSSINVLHEFVAMGIINESAESTLAHDRCVRKQLNIALKAKLVQEDGKEECRLEEIKYSFHEYMTVASINFWSNGRSFKPKQCGRTCYNCWNVGHFIEECPYEMREDNGGELIRKDKSKFLQNNSKGILSGSKPKQRVRACYNCGEVCHVDAECPFEKREDNGGMLVFKFKFLKNKNFANKP